MKKEKNDFPLRTAAKEIKISFVLTAVVDLILGVILLFAPEHVTDRHAHQRRHHHLRCVQHSFLYFLPRHDSLLV